MSEQTPKETMNIPTENVVLARLFGELDAHAKTIEKAFGVQILNRGDDVQIVGERSGQAKQVMQQLLDAAKKGETIDSQKVSYAILAFLEQSTEEPFDALEELAKDTVCMTISGRPIKAKTIGQKRYIEQMKNNTIVFGVGPAGTGKTYLAMAMAIEAFKRNIVSRIVLTRPAIEAGENLGFLPGDLQQKVDPYLRPLYDALYEIMGPENFQKNMEKGAIEVAPLAYMRGRTLDNSFIVLDEAQNTTPEQMKMFLTRIGFGSKVVVTGDVTQIDLPSSKQSGLIEAVDLLKDIEDIGIHFLTSKDVVRHPLVQKIIKAYEKKNAQNTYKQKRIRLHATSERKRYGNI